MSKQMKTSNGEAEVFVLPPNLLEKLGINLCNITQNVQNLQEPKKRKKNKYSLRNGSYSNHEGIKNNVPKPQKKNEESSILETADLMKKSVFLSPTFVPMVANTIPGEVEIVNNLDSQVDFINSSEMNEEIITDENIFNKDNEKREQNVEKVKLEKLHRIDLAKEINTSLICNGYTLKSKNKKMESDISNGILINNLIPEVNSRKENCIKDNIQRSSTSSELINNIQPLTKHKQDNSQMRKLPADSFANTDSMKNKTSTENSLSKNSKIDDTYSSDVVIDTVLSDKKYFIDSNRTLEIDEALIIPLSMTEPTSNISLSDMNGDAEEINIEIIQSLNEQESDELEIATSKNKQEDMRNSEIEVIQTNDSIIDIIKYTECDDCSDMELENILHETEILVPVASTKETIKSSHNEVINIIENKEINYTNSQQDQVEEIDLCDSIEENKILISLLPELINTSSLDIFCEHKVSDDTDKNNVNINQNVPISIPSEEVIGHVQSNEISVNSITYIQCDQTSDKSEALDNILHESEIVIPISLPSEAINNNNNKVSNSTDNRLSCNEYEAELKKESKKDEISFLSDEIQRIQEIQNSNSCFTTKYGKKNEVNKLRKSEFAKNSKDKSDELLSMYKQTEGNQHNLSNELNTCVNLQNNHVDTIAEDKIQEIAEYLKQVMQNNRKRRHSSKKGVKILKPKPGSLTKSKMFIQGVEKPGGSEDFDISFDKLKIYKTYERNKKLLKSHVTPIAGETSLKNVSRPEENYIEMNTCIQQSHTPKRQEYCLCGDFGKFSFFDVYDNLYEHIHFGSNNGVNCPVDTVFAIYSDENSVVKDMEEREYTQEEDNCAECEDCHICWQKLEYHAKTYGHPEIQSVNQNKCLLDTNLQTDISLTNSPVIQHELETEHISKLKTNMKKNRHTCVDNKACSKISDTSLMEVVVAVNSETVPSLSPAPASPICEIEEHANEKQKQSSESIGESVEIEADEVSHTDVEHNQKDNTEHQSCEIIDDFAEVAAIKASHIDTKSKEERDNAGQKPCTAVDETVDISADESIQEKRKQTMGSKTDCVKDVQESREHVKRRKRKSKKHGEEPANKKSDKCGVCQQVLSHSEWEYHISTVHCYIAWKDGQTFDFDNLLLLKKLKKKLKNDGELACSFCEFKNNHLEKFLSHVKKCISRKVPKSVSDNVEELEEATSSKSNKIECGVCHLEVDDENWQEHISHKHQYLAWKKGEPPLDTSDEEEVKTHLLNLVKMYGHLICTNCGFLRKYTPKSIKSYLSHIKKCGNNNGNESRASMGKSESKIAESKPPSHKCAVCGVEVDASKWIDHIAQEHNYRAWKEGDVVPNLEDKDALWEHLNEISKHAGGLQCSKCGVVRRYVKPFLQHTSFCTGNETVDVSNTDLTKESNERNSIESPNADTEIDKPNSSSTPMTSKTKAKTMEIQKTSCGVCKEDVQGSAWIDHIGKEHNYLAWREGATPLDTNDQEAIWQHLHDIVRIAGKLVCAKCGKARKYPKMYLSHISECRGANTSTVDDSMNESLNFSVISQVDRSLKGQNAGGEEVKCGVCQAVVGRDAWIAHIQNAHSYVAWIDGETPLDSNDDVMIRDHLQQIVDEVGTLACPKCGTVRKYAKKFLQHIKQCGTEEKPGKKSGSKSSQTLPAYEMVECGTCGQNMRINQWMIHTRATHNYLAWRPGQYSTKTPSRALKRLNMLIDKLGKLTCIKCGHADADAASYLEHSESCKGNPDVETEEDEVTKLAREGFYKCAMCSENIKYGEWREHSLSRHYTMAWVVGDEPIDILNQNDIAKVMKEYSQYGEFVCKVCGASRSSGLGFFAHVISCGLTEEEADKFKIECEICNTKYPGFYRSQHMAAHMQQEMAKQRKEIAEEDREKEKQRKLEELTASSGRRRAAEKARLVIEETASQFKHVCQSCAFATDAEEDMARHRCNKKRWNSDELDLSLEQVESSDDEPFADVEEESDEEEKTEGRKRPDTSCSARITRIPFVVSNVQEYIEKNLNDYTKTYLTTATLFPKWSTCRCEAVVGNELLEFTPRLEESCQIHTSGNWSTYKRWEATVERQKTIVFTGASIQRISWLPALASPEGQPTSVLAVACHSGAGGPQYLVDDLPQHSALIQFWDFGDFKNTPKLVFGLALPYGTVWAMEWCPSGAQEPRPKDSEKGFVRMGLLAVACSNGMAYIFAIPYPSSVVESDSVIHKLEPVAQLKFTTKSDRRLYQATSVCWSQQKGHETVIVGYADGSTAYYDLKTESPFLKSQENNVTMFYPFYDEHTHNGSITELDSFPVARASSAAGAVCAASPTGCALSSLGAAPRAARQRTHLAAASARFLPAWPAALLAGEDIVTNLTPAELEYWGMGRRAGFLQMACGCTHCAVVATFMTPFVRIMRPHHARSDLKKQVVASIGMKQLAKKRKHNEDKAVKMEEMLTYGEAISKYGIQFRLVDKANSSEDKKAISQYKEVYPECFPLSEVPSMAFCPSAKYHRKLAVATHAGFIFVFHV